jgi:hypothetical protein
VITVVQAVEYNDRTDESTEAMLAVIEEKDEVKITGEQQNVNYFNSSSLVRICASIAV